MDGNWADPESRDQPIPEKNLSIRCENISSHQVPENTQILSDWEYIEIAIKEDHVHLFMVIPPKYVVSMVIETIKKNTSRGLKKTFNFLKKVYWDMGEGVFRLNGWYQ